MPSESRRDPVDKAIVDAGGYIAGSLIAFALGFALAKQQQDYIAKWIKQTRFVWPDQFEFSGQIQRARHQNTSGVPVSVRLLILWGVVGLFIALTEQPNAFGGRMMLPLYGVITGMIFLVWLLWRYAVQSSSQTPEVQPVHTTVINTSRPLSSAPLKHETGIVYTITLPRGMNWKPENARAFMQQILEKSHRLCFQIVAARGRLMWRIVHIGADKDTGVIQQAIRAFYPEAEVKASPLKRSEFSKPFYRCTVRFTQGEMVICPLLRVDGIRKLDPLSAIVNEMSNLGEEERIVYTLYTGEIASFAYPQLVDLLSIPEPSNPMQWLVPQTQVEAAYTLVAGKRRLALYPPEHQRIFEARLNQNLYHAVLMVEVNAPNRERVEALALLTSQLKQFEHDDYPNVLYPSDIQVQQITNAEAAWRTNSIGLITDWMMGRSHDWQQSSLIVEPAELAAIWHLPYQDFYAPGIIWTKSRQVRLPDELFDHREGVYLGQNTYSGTSSPVYIQYPDRATHMAVFGMTGTGKSNFLHTMIAQDIANGKGVCVVDPLGNLVRDILCFSIPAGRESDVVVLDVANEAYPPPFNMMTLPSDAGIESASSRVMSILGKLFPDMAGTRWADTFAMALLTLKADNTATIRDVDRVLSDTAYRDNLLARNNNEALYSYWMEDFDRESENMQRELTRPIKRHLRAFFGNPYFYPISCHPQGLDFARMVQEGKIILVSLGVDESKLTAYEKRLLGALLISQIQMAATSRAAETKGFYLYVDEAQEFITSSLPTMLTQARQFNLSLTLANQYLGQLVGNTLEAVRGDVGAFVFFQLGDQDAGIAARYTRPNFEAEDLMNLDKYQAAVRMRFDTTTLPAFSLTTHLATDLKRMSAGTQNEARIRALSQKTYTPMSKDEVLKWLRERYPRKAENTSDQDEFSDPV